MACPTCRASSGKLAKEHPMLKARVYSLEVELEGWRDGEANGKAFKEEATRYRGLASRARQDLTAVTARTEAAEADRDKARAAVKAAHATFAASLAALRRNHREIKGEASALAANAASEVNRIVDMYERERNPTRASGGESAGPAVDTEAASDAVATDGVGSELLVEELESKLREALESLEDTRTSLTTANDARARAVSRMASAKDDAEVARAEAATAKSQGGPEMARRFQALKADRDTLHAAYTEAQAKMERGVEELAALTTEVAILREAASHAETESAQASATALAQVAAAQETHAAAIELQSEQHTVALNDLRHELAENHTQEIDALRRKHTDELRARKSGHAEAIKSLKTVHKTKRASSLEALRLSVEAQREAEQVVHAEALAAVEESLEEARKDLEHSKAESARRSQHVNETSQAEARARQEIGVLNFQVEHLREQLANMVHDDAARNRTTLDKMERDAAPLRDRIEMQKSEIRLLQNTVARECAERQSLVAALDTAKKTTAPTRKPGSRPSSVRLSGTPTRPMSSANRSPSATRRLPKLSKNQTV